MTTPPPDSPQAISLGCKCPVLDNAHGKGYMGVEGVYVYSGSCELHEETFRKMVEASRKGEEVQG